MIFQEPTKPPTPSEYAVITCLIAGSLVALGVVALFIAFRAPPQKHQIAAILEHGGFWSLGVGVGVAGIYWLVRRNSH